MGGQPSTPNKLQDYSYFLHSLLPNISLDALRDVKSSPSSDPKSLELSSAESEFAVLETEPPTLGSESPTLENGSPVPKYKIPALRSKSPALVNEPSTLKSEPQVLKTEIPAPVNKPPTIENGSPAPRYKIPALRNESPAVENKPLTLKNELQSPQNKYLTIPNPPASLPSKPPTLLNKHPPFKASTYTKLLGKKSQLPSPLTTPPHHLSLKENLDKMTPRKPKSKPPNPNSQQLLTSQTHLRQPSLTYDSDSATPGYISDFPPAPAPPPRTNDQMNFSVLQRLNPLITSIVSIAPFAVVYDFQTSSSAWEKLGVEGSLFICSMVPHDDGSERYCVIIPNRRGLENFCVDVGRPEDVEMGEYLFLNVVERSATDDDDEGVEEVQKVYGFWIFSEPDTSTTDTRTIIENVLLQCATSAEESRQRVQMEQIGDRNGNGHSYEGIEDENVDAGESETVSAEPRGQMSLQALFGQQRALDDEWSVKMHSPETKPVIVAESAGPPQGQERDVLGDLFRKATMGR